MSLHYHKFLRRHFTSSINYDLVGTLLSAHTRNGAKVRLAVDTQRVRFLEEEVHILERDYWFGPPLSNRILDDTNAAGSTVHGRSQETSAFLCPQEFIRVTWTVSGADEKTVMIEEHALPWANHDGRRLARFLHATRSTTQQVFTHVDGTVVCYDDGKEPGHHDRRVDHVESRTRRKVFRADGEIPTDTWSNIVALWFRHNLLVPEYLKSLQ